MEFHKFIQILGDSSRLKIINYINIHTKSVTDIVESTGLSQPLVSHHLRTLKKNGILTTTRKGAFILYSLKDSRLINILGILEKLMHENYNTNADTMFDCPIMWINKILYEK